MTKNYQGLEIIFKIKYEINGLGEISFKRMEDNVLICIEKYTTEPAETLLFEIPIDKFSKLSDLILTDED